MPPDDTPTNGKHDFLLGQIDSNVATIMARQVEIKTALEAQSARITSLETFRTRTAVGASIVMTALPFIATAGITLLK